MGRLSRGSRPSSATVVAVLALIAALAGTALAADPLATTAKLNKKEKKQVKRIAKKQIEKLASGLSVASADTATTANSAETANTANSATVADSATAAQSAGQLAGLPPASINSANETVGPSPCDVGASTTVCSSTQLQQPRTSDVLVLATGTFWGDATATGTCNVRLVNPAATSVQMEVGQQLAVHTSSDAGDGFSLPHLFQDVPAGARTFQLTCVEDTGNIRISFSRVLAVRLSG